MNSYTRVFLVLLRLAIGWHFIVEGVDKIRSVDVIGTTATNRPWTSKAYLREAQGPLSRWFHSQTADSDEEALALFAVQPVPEGQDPAKVSPGSRISPLLDQAWNEYFERFAERYQLTPEQRQLAEIKLRQAKDQAVLWLLGQKDKGDVHEIEKSFGPSATVKIRKTSRERINEYRDKVHEYQQIMSVELPSFGHDVEKQRLGALKAELSRLRGDLLAELQAPLQDSLQSVLTEEQVKTGPLDIPPKPLFASSGVTEARHVMSQWNRTDWIDFVTRYGLTIVGACLLFGLFTRTACIGGAGFLLLFYLAMPALPWLPESPKAEGHYLYINKNIIEMLALLTLATTRSGRWAGLDGLLYAVLPWHRGARTVTNPKKAN
jgi:uncharacterized membrane protein YphA (DoxX/SURF4 family)